MKYLVRDCDPNTGEPDDDGYDDEYVVSGGAAPPPPPRRRIRLVLASVSFACDDLPQLEDLEVTVADHIQKVLKPNFAAAWEEVGDEFEKEETFALASVRTLDGRLVGNARRGRS